MYDRLERVARSAAATPMRGSLVLSAKVGASSDSPAACRRQLPRLRRRDNEQSGTSSQTAAPISMPTVFCPSHAKRDSSNWQDISVSSFVISFNHCHATVKVPCQAVSQRPPFAIAGQLGYQILPFAEETTEA